MSGGSYEYLCYKEASDLASGSHDQMLQQMAERLAGLGYAKDAADETMDVLLTLRQFRTHLDVRLRRLQDVWRSVEWWDSHDSGEHSVQESLAEYREVIKS